MNFGHHIVMIKFSQRLEELKKEYKISNTEIAKILNLSSVNRIYPWLNGENMPSTKYLISLADYFDCSIEFLLGRTDNVSEKSFKSVSSFNSRLSEIMKKNNIRKIDMINNKICRPGNFHVWYKNKSIPQIDTIVKLADYFNVTVDYLLGRD